jgi:hypothetical protein
VSPAPGGGHSQSSISAVRQQARDSLEVEEHLTLAHAAAAAAAAAGLGGDAAEDAGRPIDADADADGLIMFEQLVVPSSAEEIGSSSSPLLQPADGSLGIAYNI